MTNHSEKKHQHEKKQKEVLDKQLKHAEQNVERYEQLLKESSMKIAKLEEESFLNKVKSLFHNKQEEITLQGVEIPHKEIEFTIDENGGKLNVKARQKYSKKHAESLSRRNKSYPYWLG